jgi:hypothetical protein
MVKDLWTYNIYNRIDGQLLTVAYLDMKDDLYSGGATIIFFINSIDDHFIGEIEPSRMKSLTPILNNGNNIELALDDNPVIFLYEFKN